LAAAVERELDKSAEIAVVIVRNEIENQRMTTPKTNAALLIVLAPIIIYLTHRDDALSIRTDVAGFQAN
jgi:hypothetical protein